MRQPFDSGELVTTYSRTGFLVADDGGVQRSLTVLVPTTVATFNGLPGDNEAADPMLGNGNATMALAANTTRIFRKTFITPR
jgi:hypothetical protein